MNEETDIICVLNYLQIRKIIDCNKTNRIGCKLKYFFNPRQKHFRNLWRFHKSNQISAGKEGFFEFLFYLKKLLSLISKCLKNKSVVLKKTLSYQESKYLGTKNLSNIYAHAGTKSVNPQNRC